MINRTRLLISLFACSSVVLLTTGISNAAYAEKKIMQTDQQSIPSSISGKVTQVIDSAGYTYAEVDTSKEKVWAAGPVTALKVGDQISFPTKMPMKNFHSQSMNRDFPVIYFVDNFGVNGTTPMAGSQAKIMPAANPVEGIKKADGGKTIAEIYSAKKTLDGKIIRVRGKVTKLTTGVLGKNWLHIMDSSGHDDLTVTTSAKVAIGDVVVAEGKIGVDKDYGYGYVYAVILEDAKITK